MRNSIKGVLIILIVVIFFIISSWILINTNSPGLEYADGFTQADLTIPTIPAIDPKPIVHQPEANSTIPPTEFITPILLTNISLDAIYTRYGGVIEVSLDNIDNDNDIFVYEFGIIPDWGVPNTWYSTASGVLVGSNQRGELGLISFPGPLEAGSHSYSLQLNILVQHANDSSWYDWGELKFQAHSINIKPLPDLEDSLTLERYHNLANFFEQINDIVDPFEPDIRNLAVSIARNYSGNYNIYQISAIFDYIRDNIAYVGDPVGNKNYWATPSETLEICGGDCEDHATLLASMIMAIGGTTRMYMTDTHAFTTVYIGAKASTRDAILEAIEEYYGTALDFAWIEDELGYWLVADTGSSFYLGGLPVNSISISSSSDYESMSFSFIEISKLFSVDIMPE